MQAGALLAGFEPVLTAANQRAVAAALTLEVAQALEAAIMKTTYNRVRRALVPVVSMLVIY